MLFLIHFFNKDSIDSVNFRYTICCAWIACCILVTLFTGAWVECSILVVLFADGACTECYVLVILFADGACTECSVLVILC